MTITQIIDFIKNFGFPIAVSIWALWRLDRTWGKGENIHTTLQNIEDDLAETKQMVKRNIEIQTELVTTMKIIQTIIGGVIK